MSDGKYIFIPVGNNVVRFPLVPDAEEYERRLWLTRPDPDWHVQRQQELMNEQNDYGVALHQSLEHRARAIAAFDFGRIIEGMTHLAEAKAAAVAKD